MPKFEVMEPKNKAEEIKEITEEQPEFSPEYEEEIMTQEEKVRRQGKKLLGSEDLPPLTEEDKKKYSTPMEKYMSWRTMLQEVVKEFEEPKKPNKKEKRAA